MNEGVREGRPAPLLTAYERRTSKETDTLEMTSHEVFTMASQSRLIYRAAPVRRGLHVVGAQRHDRGLFQTIWTRWRNESFGVARRDSFLSSGPRRLLP